MRFGKQRSDISHHDGQRSSGTDPKPESVTDPGPWKEVDGGGPCDLQTLFPRWERQARPLAELRDWLLDWRSKGSDDEKIHWKSLLTKVISQKQRCTLPGVEGINNVIMAFKEAEVVILSHPHVTLGLAGGEGTWALENDSGLP